MGRQGLRSSRAEDRIPREEPAEENTEQNELDQTIVEIPEESRSTSSTYLQRQVCPTLPVNGATLVGPMG